MPDSRKHRGPHPKDRELFAKTELPALRAAVADMSWLLSRGYAERSVLKLVGDRHSLVARQREAVRRSVCSDEALQCRSRREVDGHAPIDGPVGIDGYNVLITIESALGGGMVLEGRDGCSRDLASIHGTYRKVLETAEAIALVGDFLSARRAQRLDWFLDRPVSNSGLLRRFISERLASWPGEVEVRLVDDPDRALATYHGVVVSSDSWILDRCQRWLNLSTTLVDQSLPRAWCVKLA